MEHVAPQRRRRSGKIAAAGAALVLAVIASSCSGGPVGASPAATVGDAEISRSLVLDVVESQRTLALLEADVAEPDAEPDAEPGAEPGAGDTPDPTAGEGLDTVNTATAAAATGFLIQLELLRVLAADADVDLTDEQRDTARGTVVTNLTQTGVAEDDLPELLVDLQTEFTALQQALPAAYAPTDAELVAAYEEQAPTLEQVCISVILTDDETSIGEALARVEAGEDFRDVSAEVTTDPQLAEARGGEDCYPAASLSTSFGDEVSAAAEGDIVGPVELQGVWGALVVNERRSPTLDEVREEISNTLSQEASQDAIAAVLEEATVTVDPRFGTWNPQTASVDEPVVPGATTTTGPTLDIPGS